MTANELEGKVALVTGSTRGIGKGIARVLAEKGAHVVLNAEEDPVSLDELMDEFNSFPSRVRFVRANVCRENEVAQLFETIQAEFGRLDILVNNAGTSIAQDIFETSVADWHTIIDTNLTSCFLCSKAAMERMKTSGGGRIVNISSVVGHRGAQYGHVHYAASKSALFGMTKTLARTGAPLGIRVNTVAPGIIETELLAKTHGPERLAELASAVPLGLGTPRNVGLAVAFFCGEGGEYLTGATLDVNGGMY